MGKLKMSKLILSMCGTNCYIIYNSESKDGFIIDPADSPERIDDAVKQLGVTVKAILLTHGHFDHIGAADALKRKYDVRVYAQEEEAEITENGMLNLSAMFGDSTSVVVDIKLKDGQQFSMCDFDISVIHTPGHTKGSCCYIVEDEEKKRLFSGDTLFCGSHGRTDFPTGSERQIFDSIIDKLLVLDDDMEVYSGHGQMTFIGDEKKWYRR